MSLPKQHLKISIMWLMVLDKPCNGAVKSLATGYYGCSKFTCAPGVAGEVNGGKLKQNLFNSKTRDCDSGSPKTHIVGKQNNIPGKLCCIPGVFFSPFPGHLDREAAAGAGAPSPDPAQPLLCSGVFCQKQMKHGSECKHL